MLTSVIQVRTDQRLVVKFRCPMSSGIPEAETFGRKGKFSAFGFRFRPPKLKAEYGRNSRKALDFLLFVHENIANVNYQW